MTVETNSRDCIILWEDELERVKNELTVATATTNDAYQQLVCINEWEQALKVYWDNIRNTKKKTKSVSDEIALFISHVSDIQGYTTCTVTVSEMLFCMIQGYFRAMDQLKKKITDLLTQIECLNNPDINPRTSIVLKTLMDLNAKLDAAISTQGATINNALNTIDKAREMNNMMGTEESGLTKLLGDLHQLYNMPTASTDPNPLPSYGQGCHEQLGSCNSSIEPKPVLPLENDPYYIKTREQYMLASGDEENNVPGEQDVAQDTYNNARQEQQKLTDSKLSLEKAIAAAKTAKGC